VDFSYYQRGERESILGAGVQAILPGWVSASLLDTFPYGNFILIETPAHLLPESLIGATGLGEGQSLYTVYAHLDAGPLAAVGEWVEACQLLGQVGRSGNANVAHLHLETRTGPAGAIFLHMSYYQPDDTTAERENYLRWRTRGEYLHFDPMLVLHWAGP
jgi:murein DD-endopeptidase MepM/ murein hydrolase activator NlpD